MSLFDHQASKKILEGEPTFDGVILAAFALADGPNGNKLRAAFPLQYAEAQLRAKSADGLLEGERTS